MRPNFGLMLALAWAYLGAIFVVGEYRVPFELGLGGWLLSIAIVLVAGNRLARWAVQRQMISASTLANLHLLGVVTVGSLVVLDVGYSMYLNSASPSFDTTRSRLFDENTWVGELYPRVYYPSERNFALHKPNILVSGSLFGNFYSTSMLNSPTLVDSVLEKHAITIRINGLGFRESSEIGAAEIVTLGDSFTFGWGVDEAESWPGLLESQLGRSVYNLGIHDASPRQELELLKHVLREQGEKIRIRKLLWMFYEGNDLEDDYTEEVQRQDVVRVPLTRGTVIEAMERFMGTIKRQSVVYRLRRGQIAWKTAKAVDASNPYSVDGVALLYPLYHSKQLGPRLFSKTFVDLAAQPASYVRTHWNRGALEEVIGEMRSLADEHDFEVAVITAPTASRLHGPHFDNFPKISERPHFLDFVEELSSSAGFATVDLYELMKPYAGTELLYFRDDDHFNRRGNSLAAELIQRELFTSSD
jgi:lysophospholipase L1-like esterase